MTGIKVSDYIRPISINDTYPTHLDVFGKGGLHSVASVLERNAITQDRRKEGMFAYTADNKVLYTLLGGLTNADWIKLLDYSTGEISFNIPCKENYILIGDKNNIIKQSPILIDIRQDIIALRRNLDKFERLDKLDHNRIWIGDYKNEPEERINIGVINLPILGAATFPYPSIIPLPPIPIPNPTFDPFSGFDWLMSGPWLPQIFAGSTNTLNTSSETIISSSLAMTQVKTAQAIKRLDNAGFIVKSKTIDFDWENPAMLLIPEAIKQLYGLNTSYTFTNAQPLDELAPGLLKQNPSVTDNTKADGNIVVAVAGKDYVDVAASVDSMQLALIRPLLQDADGNDIAKLLSRVDRLPDDNMPNLTFILQRPNTKIPNAQGLSDLAGGILKSAPSTGEISIASGGKYSWNDYVTPDNLAEEKTDRIVKDQILESNIAAVQTELEAQILAITGYATLGLLAEFLVSIGWTTGYSEYLWNKYKPLHTENKYGDTDNYDKQAGNIWYDSNNTTGLVNFRPGLRLTSWDSSTLFDSDLAPISMGLFGYKNAAGYVPAQEGFVWQSFFENDSGNSHYRFPKSFGLYYVGHDKGQIGWNRGEALLMEYRYYDEKFYYEKAVDFKNHVNFKETVEHNNYVNFKETVDFQKDVKFLTNGSIKIPVGNTNERPSILEVGMIRFNVDL